MITLVVNFGTPLAFVTLPIPVHSTHISVPFQDGGLSETTVSGDSGGRRYGTNPRVKAERNSGDMWWRPAWLIVRVLRSLGVFLKLFHFVLFAVRVRKTEHFVIFMFEQQVVKLVKIYKYFDQNL